MRAAGVQGPGAKFPAVSFVSETGNFASLVPQRSGGRVLARSGPPAIIGRAEGNEDRIRPWGPSLLAVVGSHEHRGGISRLMAERWRIRQDGETRGCLNTGLAPTGV
jgi:hypothetical protein